MRLSTLFGRTLREAPADAEGIGYQLAMRAGLIRAAQAGSFALMPLGMRVIRKIEAIMHAELAAIGAQEFRTPLIQTADAWQASGRFETYGPLMLRLQDRSERQLIVAPTHEEAIAAIAHTEISSYRHLPALVYQIHTKYRDELRVKGGLLRMREFTMLDAYSLDADQAGLDQIYQKVGAAFERILARCGLEYHAVSASAGEMGGSENTEYHVLSDSGEDKLLFCATCGYAANQEIATSYIAPLEETSNSAPIELVATPEAKTIADVANFLQLDHQHTAKAVFFYTPVYGVIFALVRGDQSVSEAKLAAALGVSELVAATTEQIEQIGAIAGYASAVGLDVRTTLQASSGVLVITDPAVVAGGPLVVGANRTGYHLRNAVYGRDWQATLVADIHLVEAGAACPNCQAALQIQHGVEVGHIFKLGTRYASALGAIFLDQHGQTRPIVMGSYGLGLERIMQLVIEQHHDQFGIQWPASIAPFDLHLVHLGNSEAVQQAAEALLSELQQAGWSVLYDDRQESAGIKFNDADLIGIPIRLVISERLLKQGLIEIKPRSGSAYSIERTRLIAELQPDRQG